MEPCVKGIIPDLSLRTQPRPRVVGARNRELDLDPRLTGYFLGLYARLVVEGV